MSALPTGSATYQKDVEAGFSELGQDYLDAATALSALPAPSFTGGADFAARQIAGFTELGDTAAAAGKSASTGDMTKYKSLTSSLGKGPAATAMSATKPPAGVVAEFKALPACAALKS